MTAFGPLVLPDDVMVVPAAEIACGLREQIDHQPGDHCVTRPLSRATTSLVDSDTAAFLDRFREPTTIVDAVIAFSAASGTDPRQTLTDVLPVLAGFIRDGVLLPADSALAARVEASLAPGRPVAGGQVVEPVHVLLDTEVYRLRLADGTTAALKIVREGAQADIAPLLHREAATLRSLDGRHNPHLVDAGEHAGRSFLVQSWIAGVDSHDAAAEARRLGGPEGVAVLLSLADGVVAAFSHLHTQDVLHGDVHPRNVLVDGQGRVVLLDFGLAVRISSAANGGCVRRGGVDFFLDPEGAQARLDGQSVTSLTQAGEQYSVAALIYHLLTGAHTHTFSLHAEHMLRQLRDEPVLPFDAHVGPKLPATEEALRRALDKDPDRRYPSLAHLLESLRTAAASDRAAPRTAPPSRTKGLLDKVLARLAAPGPLFDGGLAPPTSSAMNGGAGLAYALLRIARSRGDRQLLAQADLWAQQAEHRSAAEGAFVNRELGITREVVGDNSFYHHISGVHWVQALIAETRGDHPARDKAIEAFLRTASAPSPELDVAFGRSGLLLGCAMLLEACSGSSRHPALLALGTTLRDSVWSDLADADPIGEGPRRWVHGAAHGWSGYLFAVLRWAQASKSPAPEGIADRLDQLASLAQPAGRGLLWPFDSSSPRTDTLMGAS
ncbi:Lanthionine synthetase C-like protein [Micromonospora halophytica]|uniref:Lanthionine synthetase C-like protein n=1 Tax=Micromonospora halophytica TaxID=47864 RepID=A0A1C5J7B3_9ACTN|nr:Lanthionine synthetase C-like protein [Micromonospora halophytica]